MLRSKFTQFLSFWNSNSVFLRILHQSSASWDINPLYFLSWNFIYFQQKEPMKVQIWWSFRWAVEVWNLSLWWVPFVQIIKSFSYKSTEELSLMTLKSDAKVKRKTDLWFQIWHEEFDEFSPDHSKVWKIFFNGLFLSKVYKVWVTKIQRSYLS